MAGMTGTDRPSADYVCASVGYVQSISPTGFDIVGLNSELPGGPGRL